MQDTYLHRSQPSERHEIRERIHADVWIYEDVQLFLRHCRPRQVQVRRRHLVSTSVSSHRVMINEERKTVFFTRRAHRTNERRFLSSAISRFDDSTNGG